MNEPERLTSNWMRVAKSPDVLRYFEPSGAVDSGAMATACRDLPFPAIPREHGFFSFATVHEINEALAATGRFKEKHAFELLKFLAEGAPQLELRGKDASNIGNAMYRVAWHQYCRARGFIEYAYSKESGFHVGEKLAKIGQKVPWGRQGDRRSSMLRNQAKGTCRGGAVHSIRSRHRLCARDV